MVVEDDYDGEFRLGGRPLDALQTLDRDRRVFYIGTFSKCLSHSVRIEFVVDPAWARSAQVAAKQICNWHVSAPTQATLAAFIDEGELARHMRKMHGDCAGLHDALLAALARHLGAELEAQPSLAGLHLRATPQGAARAERWMEAAREAGIRIESLARHTLPPLAPNGLVFGFGLIDRDAIEPTVRALAAAARKL